MEKLKATETNPRIIVTPSKRISSMYVVKSTVTIFSSKDYVLLILILKGSAPKSGDNLAEVPLQIDPSLNMTLEMKASRKSVESERCQHFFF
jgi:hypothetical protein